jgi:hypothetical protein
MEIVLQWLDELDDLAFAAFSIWSRLRRICLAVALLAALGLHVFPVLGLAAGLDFLFLEVSLASLGIWAIVGTLAARADQSGNQSSVNG